MPLIPYPTIENLAVQALLKPEPDPDDRALITGAVTAIVSRHSCRQKTGEELFGAKPA